MQLRERTVIVTGASSGIGRATARTLAQAGANVVLAARSKAKLEDLARELKPLSARAIPVDVTERLSVEALMRRASEEFGAIDVLVNNAGVGLFAPIADGNPDNARYLFDVNVWGAVNCIQAAAPYMRDQGEGHIVNVSSIAGHISPPYMGMYAATKHALAAISDALRNEVASDGIGVTTVYPGLTETAFTENMLQEVEAPRIPPIVRFVPAEAVARRIYQAIRWNLRDVYVAPEDIAAILSDALLPAISDRVLRLFIRPGARRDVSFRRRVAERESSSELADS